MKTKLRALVQLDNIVPALIIIVAFVVSIEPEVFGVVIPERQIILLLFGLLGIDAVTERSGRLHQIGKKIDLVEQYISGRPLVEKVLRTRASFARMDALIADERRNTVIIGVNLEGAVIALSSIIDLAKAGVTTRLLSMDPDGTSIDPTARMSGVDPEVRRQKIRQNLNHIKSQLSVQLSQSARRKVKLQVVDRILPIGVTGTDTDSHGGWLIIQHYLAATPAERAPMLQLYRDSDREWYDRYLLQCNRCFDGAREW
jgi:hypothetical protein